MSKDIFPHMTLDRVKTRKKFAPHIHDTFTTFRERAFADGPTLSN